MSNLTWKKLWKDVIIDFYNLSNSAPEALIFDSALKINNLFIKNSNKEFKIYENINKNKNFFQFHWKMKMGGCQSYEIINYHISNLFPKMNYLKNNEN